MLTILALLLVQGSTASQPPPIVSGQGVEIYSDKKRSITVRFAETPFGTVILTSYLPAGWSFSVMVDGDQNGVWGTGRGNPNASALTSRDRSFGQNSRNGVFCSQYILTTFENDPNEIYASSACGGLRSDGRAILTGFDGKMWATIALEIPADEFFGALPSAHIQACVWNTTRWNCQHRLPALLELERTVPARSR